MGRRCIRCGLPDTMGKNKTAAKTSKKNPIYKKAGAGAALKTKSKAKQVKTNLKKLKINNKEEITALDQRLGTFREALQNKAKETKRDEAVRPRDAEPSVVDMEETAEGLSRLTST
ncbi:uncharacterized protein LOC126992432 isoform X2 [Eriocheir sinensis]|uniref:uncharacterized protein LOC126992432 isoform X2 n=1 Tax=Eriocheir sinensis TaxID=95602 RepID=UPI0021C70987|nr:uncharacterized protein LOC126992432 isoform X2 [Eriocheir sinensis]